MSGRATTRVYIIASALVTAAYGFACGGACGGDSEANAGEQRVSEEPDETQGTSPSSFPTDFAPLGESLENFEDVANCTRDLREQIPIDVAEGLSNLGYDAFIHDVCVSLGAAKDRNSEACAALTGSAMQSACELRVALLSSDPELCPDDQGRPGKDARCLAWASRNLTLCRASQDRALCEAVLLGSSESCHAQGGVREAACVATVERLGGILEPVEPRRGASPETRLAVTGEGFHLPTRLPAEGVYVERELGVYSVAIFTARHATGSDRMELELEFASSSEAPLTIPIGGLTTLRIVPRVGTPLVAESGSIQLERFSSERGQRLTGTIEAVLSPGDVAIRGEFATYVRDLGPPD